MDNKTLRSSSEDLDPIFDDHYLEINLTLLFPLSNSQLNKKYQLNNCL